MYTFLIITAILSLIGWGCLRKRFSLGIVPIMLISSLISGLICIVLNVSIYKIQGPDKVWNDTIRYESTQLKFSITKTSVIGTRFDLDEITKVVVEDSLKVPYINLICRNESKDMNLIWDMGFSDDVECILYLNPKQHGIYKAFRDSLEKRKSSL